MLKNLINNTLTCYMLNHYGISDDRDNNNFIMSTITNTVSHVFMNM